MSVLGGIAITYLCVALCTSAVVWIGHGIYETNLIKTTLKSLYAFLWPIWALNWIKRNWPAMWRRLISDWREAFPQKQITPPSPVDVSTLGTSEPKHLPGGWIDHV
jgi:hypothetical protein